MAELSYIHCIYFPPEIIESFAPADSPQTISSLKLVSKRFNEIFSQDKFYKHYLYYEEKYYLSDLKLNSTAVGVAEAVEQIKSGKVGKWKGYLKLQKAHLANLMAERTDNFMRVENPPPGFGDLVEHYDEDGEHWLLCCSQVNRQITLFNITTGFQTITRQVHWFGRTVLMLPGGQLLLELEYCFGSRLFAVYSFSRNVEDNSLSFEIQYKFYYVNDGILSDTNDRVDAAPHFESVLHAETKIVVLSDKCRRTSQITNILVGSLDENIHVWNLKLPSKIREISIHDHKIWHDFVEVHGKCNVELGPGDFPYLICQLRTQNHLRRQVTVYDVVKDRVIYVLGEFKAAFRDAVKCSMNSNLICLIYKNFESGKYRLNLYRLGSSLNPQVVLTHPCNKPGLFCSMYMNRFDQKSKKILWTEEKRFKILTVSETGVHEQYAPEPERSRNHMIGFIEPDILLVSRGGFAREPKIINAISTFTGKSLFTFPIEVGHFHTNLRYPSKIIIRESDGYRIYYM